MRFTHTNETPDQSQKDNIRERDEEFTSILFFKAIRDT
jgi:hypothetical protein